MKCHCGNKDGDVRLLYFPSGIFYTGKMASIFKSVILAMCFHKLCGYMQFVYRCKANGAYDLYPDVQLMVDVMAHVGLPFLGMAWSVADFGNNYLVWTDQWYETLFLSSGFLFAQWIEHVAVSFELYLHTRLTHWGRDKMDAILQTTFSNALSWMKMYEFRLGFHWSLFLTFELTIFQHWFR